MCATSLSPPTRGDRRSAAREAAQRERDHEGVGSAALRTRLARLGADRLQGFAIARPMSADKVDAYIRRQAVPELAM
jgi:predicted signal transduction protein with EAL and GGDEF domain